MYYCLCSKQKKSPASTNRSLKTQFPKGMNSVMWSRYPYMCLRAHFQSGKWVGKNAHFLYTQSSDAHRTFPHPVIWWYNSRNTKFTTQRSVKMSAENYYSVPSFRHFASTVCKKSRTLSEQISNIHPFSFDFQLVLLTLHTRAFNAWQKNHRH